MKIQKNGISLIILVITIIVIIILAGSVILSLSQNNPISQASKATYLSDLKNFQTELELYQSTQFANNLGSYNPALLQADNDSVTYNGIIDTSITMNDIIPSVTQSSKYSGQFQVIAGKLIYGGLDTTKQDWTREAGLEVVIIGEPKITILAPLPQLAERGTNIVYTVKFSSNVALTTVNLTDKVEVLDAVGVALTVQPVISIGAVSGTATDTARQVDITITTSDLANGTYKLKIKPGVVTNSSSISNTIDTISLIEFDIVDNVPPANPTMVASVAGWTNGNVSVTISYSTDSVTKEYSTNGTTWSAYTIPVVVTSNSTVYARGKDIATNESGVATLTVANIDKIVPIVAATNGSSTTSSVTVTAVASDAGGSTLNAASYQYSKDNGTTWTAVTNATSYTFSSITTGTYQCKVKVADNALNTTTSSSVAISTTGLGTIALVASPTGWTNGNVTVTITYPTEVVTKQYSTNGTTWNTYTAPVVVTTNNTTVYAKGLDAGGNQTTQATLTVSNIDKIVPVITASNGGTTTSSVTVTAVASDAGGSTLNAASYQYSKDNGTTWTAVTNATSYTFSSITTGTYQCKVKVADNALNTTTSSAVAISTTGLGTIALVASPTGWTNGNVTVTITYPTEVVTKQYSTDGTTWNTYTAAVVVTTNSTVYAKGLDAGGNQTTQATLTVANIDKTVPVVAATNGGTTTSSVTVTAVASDTSGSGVVAASYQYSKDNGATWTTSSSATSYTFSTLLAGTYQCKVKVVDNAGNTTTSSAVALTTISLGAVTLVASPTAWTNGNVSVTVTYPTAIVTKQYSTNGTTWFTYTVPVVISTNNTTVYAKGLDAGGNQTTQATLTVSNIDKVTPVVSFTDELKVNINTVIDATFLKNNTTITDNVSTIGQINIVNIQVLNSSATIVGNTLSGYDLYNINYGVSDTAGNVTNVSRTIITKPIGSINLTNILPDPSFELGSAYWYNMGGESIRVTERAYSGSYSFRVYSNLAQNWPRYNYDNYNIQGKAIYARLYAYKTSNTINPGITFVTTATTEEWPTQSFEYPNYWEMGPINQWNVMSVSIPNAQYRYLKIMVAQTNQNATGYVWFDGLMVIDLNATFGSNVPTIKWMDKMIPYFDVTGTFSW